MSTSVTMHEAKTHLSRLVKTINDGTEREIIISVGGVPSARLVPYEAPSERRLGMDDGLIWISDDFDATDDELVAAFEGTS